MIWISNFSIFSPDLNLANIFPNNEDTELSFRTLYLDDYPHNETGKDGIWTLIRPRGPNNLSIDVEDG
jgi:hypothetical protein